MEGGKKNPDSHTPSTWKSFEYFVLELPIKENN